MKVGEMKKIENGYSCTGGIAEDGSWYSAVRIIRGRDEEYSIPGDDRWKPKIRENTTLQNWLNSKDVSQKLVLVKNDGRQPELLSDSKRIYGPGPVKTDENSIMAVWSEKRQDKWHLIIRKNEKNIILSSSEEKISQPSGCLEKNIGYAAACREIDGTPMVFVYSEDGTEYIKTEGRRPVICFGKEKMFILCEYYDKDNSRIILKLISISLDKKIESIMLGNDDININGDIIYDTAEDRLLITWESCPAWGYDEHIGIHRDINIWCYNSKNEVAPWEGTADGKLLLSKEAFTGRNMPPIYPKLFTVHNVPAITYRRFRLRGKACTGWDVYLHELNNSDNPVHNRINRNVGMADSEYSIAEAKDGIIGFFPCFDNDPGNTKIYNIRTEIEYIPDKGYEKKPLPQRVKDYYMIPPSVKEIALEPSEEFKHEEGYELIWGDIHTHTYYSKCMSSIDGSPDNRIRFQKEIMGYDVMTFTDHHHQMGAEETFWLTEKLEELTDDSSIVLYSCEPGVMPGEHTNFYTFDRNVFNKLRIIISTFWNRDDIYKAIKEHLPKESVIAVRHFHGFGGNYGIQSDETITTWDPEIEKSMEAIQIRGNILMGNIHRTEQWKEPLPRFPGNFLDSGAEIGLVGGTDHRGFGLSNHFGLTGFWVTEKTSKGVYDAIRNRMTIACSNGKMALWTDFKGLPMGSKAEIEYFESVEINVKISSAWTIRRVCLLRDGEPLEWVDIDDNKYEGVLTDKNCMPGRHWYSVTAEGDTGFSDGSEKYDKQINDHLTAHASPYFINKKER